MIPKAKPTSAADLRHRQSISRQRARAVETTEIQKAIDNWRKQASDPLSNAYMQSVCERTAQALEIQRDTGIAVCVCCHKPYGSHH